MDNLAILLKTGDHLTEVPTGIDSNTEGRSKTAEGYNETNNLHWPM